MNKSELTVERNALISLVLTMILAGAVIWINVLGVVRISNNDDRLAHSDTIVMVLQILKEHLADVETGERGYIITGNESYLVPHEHGLNMVYKLRDELSRLLADEPTESNIASELSKRLDAKIAVSQANVLARKLGFEAARSRVMEGSGKREMDALQVILDKMSNTQSERHELLSLQRKEILQEMQRNIVIAAVMAISVLLYLHLRLLRLMKARYEAEQHVHHLATHDVLTGLSNRRLMLAHMEQAMQRSKRNNKRMAILFLDLNGFKPVNDQYGHKAGDEVLNHVARRLSAAMRASDRVARFGGDEFVVLAEDVTDKADVCGIVGKVDAEICSPILLQKDVEVTISTSIGVAIYPEDGEDLETLLRTADTAMYASKKDRSNCFCKEQNQSRRCELNLTEKKNEVSHLPL
jgi:diguanylate cyclase (GGDEF)-like protein